MTWNMAVKSLACAFAFYPLGNEELTYWLILADTVRCEAQNICLGGLGTKNSPCAAAEGVDKCFGMEYSIDTRGATSRSAPQGLG